MRVSWEYVVVGRSPEVCPARHLPRMGGGARVTGLKHGSHRHSSARTPSLPDLRDRKRQEGEGGLDSPQHFLS